MKTLLAVGMASLLVTDVALAQNGNMMNGSTSGAGWMGGYGGYGGYGGMWVPLLVVIVVAALVVWVVQRKGK